MSASGERLGPATAPRELAPRSRAGSGASRQNDHELARRGEAGRAAASFNGSSVHCRRPACREAGRCVGGLIRASRWVSYPLIAMNRGAGFAGHLAGATVPSGLARPVTAAAVLDSLVGGRLAGRIAPDTRRRGFAWFVAVMAVFELAQRGPKRRGVTGSLARHRPWRTDLRAPVSPSSRTGLCVPDVDRAQGVARATPAGRGSWRRVGGRDERRREDGDRAPSRDVGAAFGAFVPREVMGCGRDGSTVRLGRRALRFAAPGR